MTNFSKTSLVELLSITDNINNEYTQEIVNAAAIEITRRWYYPSCGMTRSEFLSTYGYKDINKDKPKRKVKRK